MWVICLPGFNIFSEVWSVSILLEHVRLPELISDCSRELKTQHPACQPAIPPTGRGDWHANPVTGTCLQLSGVHQNESGGHIQIREHIRTCFLVYRSNVNDLHLLSIVTLTQHLQCVNWPLYRRYRCASCPSFVADSLSQLCSFNCNQQTQHRSCSCINFMCVFTYTKK